MPIKSVFDRNNFFQNLLLDNLLLVDIYNRAKKLHVEVTCPRAIYLIETKDEKDGIVSEVLKSMFSPQSGDYVTAVDESSLILIKSVENTTTPQALHELAETIVAMMNAEALLDVKVAYGTVVQELKDVSKSYKEAKMALDVGKDLLCREESNCVQHTGNRTTDLSASGESVQNLHRRDLRRQCTLRP